MTTFLFIGTVPMDFPAEAGVTVFADSFTVQPGDTVEADENPNPQWFDPTDGNQNAANPSTAEMAGTVQE